MKLICSMFLMSFVAFQSQATEGILVRFEGNEAYKAYQHLNSEEIHEGKITRKVAKGITCMKSSYYPGDLDYECEFYLNEDGLTLIQ